MGGLQRLPIKVSVIIPTFKRHHLLNKAVDSVLNQSYDNIEIIVIDDNPAASEERNLTIGAMRKYENNDKVMYCLNEKPCGGGPARNKGIEKAVGEYVTFLDDDDIYLPRKVETQLKFMVENDLEMSFTDIYICRASGRLIEYRYHPYLKNWSNDEMMRRHVLHHLGGTPSFMIRRDSLIRSGGFDDIPLGQDFMLMWRMIENGTRIGYLPVSHIIAYFHSEERISAGKNRLKAEDWIYELKKTKLSLLNKKERRYLEFRHGALLAVLLKRNSDWAGSVKYAVKTAVSYPVFFVVETVKTMKYRVFVKYMEPQTAVKP